MSRTYDPSASHRIAKAHAAEALARWSATMDAEGKPSPATVDALDDAARLYGVDPAIYPAVTWARLKRRLETCLRTEEPGEPTEADRSAIRRARRANQAKPTSPEVRRAGDGPHSVLTASHADLDGWEHQLAAAFGTRSRPAIRSFVNQLGNLTPGDPDAVKLNAALDMINGMKPRNAMEGALLAQMVAVHWLTMDAAAQASPGNLHAVAVTSKAARTFAMQVDAWSRLRGRVGRQSIKVRVEKHTHQHVHMHGGASGNGGQPESPSAVERPGFGRVQALAHEGGTSLPRQDQAGDVVPITRRKGA